MAAAEIMPFREIAALLRIGEKMAYAIAQSGKLSGFKVRGQRRVRRTNLDEWSCETRRAGSGALRVGRDGRGVNGAPSLSSTGCAYTHRRACVRRSP